MYCLKSQYVFEMFVFFFHFKNTSLAKKMIYNWQDKYLSEPHICNACHHCVYLWARLKSEYVYCTYLPPPQFLSSVIWKLACIVFELGNFLMHQLSFSDVSFGPNGFNFEKKMTRFYNFILSQWKMNDTMHCDCMRHEIWRLKKIGL